jgi:hypothetical protein
VRAFLEWFAPYQYPNGKIPCVVDRRGADPVPEHDSAGEFVFLVAEYWRYERDRVLLEAMWPRVRAAAAWLDGLRRERRTDAWRSSGHGEFFGLLPPSISHEGYSAKPMHSYWDDFFALKGFEDAAFLAGELGLAEEAARLAAIRDEFAADLGASVRAAMAVHGIDWVPGCADLGDFDATSTTIAWDPTGAWRVLPAGALERTFEKYWENFSERRASDAWDVYTPYELRTVGALARLGRRDRAAEALRFFLEDQRPRGWLQWPEVVGREPRRPRFLGDLPHGWVASDFVRSALDLLAYAEGEVLVLAEGVPDDWLADDGLVVKALRTPWGELDFSMRRGPDGAVQAEIGGTVRPPSAGIVLRSGVAAPSRVTVNGADAARGGDVVVRALPARVRVEP